MQRHLPWIGPAMTGSGIAPTALRRLGGYGLAAVGGGLIGHGASAGPAWLAAGTLLLLLLASALTRAGADNRRKTAGPEVLLDQFQALDQNFSDSLKKAVSLSETSSLNTATRVNDLRQLSGRLLGYLDVAQAQSTRMQRDIEYNGSIIAELATFVQQLPRQIEQERLYLDRLMTEVRHLSGVSETIRRMARQTEILSINAAVEAARAGEAGRSFSVLAGEIRRLALESSASASGIEQAIRTLVDNVQSRGEGEFAERMQHNEQEAARLQTLTEKLDEGYLDMRQFYSMLLTTITEHNATLNREIIHLLDAGQYHDVFRQIIERLQDTMSRRHDVLSDITAQMSNGHLDIDRHAERVRQLIDEYIHTESRHGSHAGSHEVAADAAADAAPRIELF